MLCPVCGYPKCECLRCADMRRGLRTAKTGHACWLAGKAGRAPRTGHKETEEQAQQRTDAWAACGCETDVPTWLGACYGWPSGEEGAAENLAAEHCRAEAPH